VSTVKRYVLHKLTKMVKRRTLKGKLNDLIDLVFHPLFKEHPAWRIIDFVAHCLVEGEINIEKFIRYNLGDLTCKPRSKRGFKSRRSTSQA